MSRPPIPLEWHPAYREMPWLLDWLNGPERYLQLPLMVRTNLTAYWTEDETSPSTLRTITFRKQWAYGPAPWTEAPFYYEWTAGVDNIGRMIAGESRRVPLE